MAECYCSSVYICSMAVYYYSSVYISSMAVYYCFSVYICSMAVCYCSSVYIVLWQCVATHLFDIGSMARSMFLVDTHHNLNSEAIHFQPISSILINQYFSSKASHVQFKFIRLVMFSWANNTAMVCILLDLFLNEFE